MAEGFKRLRLALLVVGDTKVIAEIERSNCFREISFDIESVDDNG